MYSYRQQQQQQQLSFARRRHGRVKTKTIWWRVAPGLLLLLLVLLLLCQFFGLSAEPASPAERHEPPATDNERKGRGDALGKAPLKHHAEGEFCLADVGKGKRRLDEPLPLGVQPWTPPASAFLSYTLLHEMALPRLRRPGEQDVTQARFLRCLADRLNVDVAARTQGSLVAEDTTPLIVFPMMMEVNDHRQLMCNMTNTIRYVMYVDNGGLTALNAFLSDIVKVFGWTGRVAVRRYPWNAGCAGAVNNAIDWAIRLPQEEVPFIQFCNHDVRFVSNALVKRVRHMHEATKIDVQRIRELEEEVAREDADPATWAHYRSGRALRGTWSPNATLVTSRLLPDRIRYMPMLARRKEFIDHTGLAFFDEHGDTSTFLVSRLALLTVGYNDENFYPAYFEDIDYEWRLSLLGFREAFAAAQDAGLIHYGSAMAKLSDLDDMRTDHNDISAEKELFREEETYVRTLRQEVSRVKKRFQRYMTAPTMRQYAIFKWGSADASPAVPGLLRRAEPFYPASMWSVDATTAKAEYLGFVLRALEKERTTAGLPMPSAQALQEIMKERRWVGEALKTREASQVFNDYKVPPLDTWVRDPAFRAMTDRFMDGAFLGDGGGDGGDLTPHPYGASSSSGYNATLVESFFATAQGGGR